MKNTRFGRLAFGLLRWWRDMVHDLTRAKECVDDGAKRLHYIAGRAHVLEMEAYGETKPRQTLPPGSQC